MKMNVLSVMALTYSMLSVTTLVAPLIRPPKEVHKSLLGHLTSL